MYIPSAIGSFRIGCAQTRQQWSDLIPYLLHNQPRWTIIGPIPSPANPLRPPGSPLARVHFPPRPDPPGPVPPSSSGGPDATAAIRMYPVRQCSGEREWGKRRELTEEDHQGENVHPVFLKERLLCLGRDDLALGCKRWRRAQFRPGVAFDQTPDHICTRFCHHTGPTRNQRPDLVGQANWGTHNGGSLGFRT